MVIHVDLWICTGRRGVESNSNLGPVKVHMRAVRSVTLRLAKHAAYVESQNLNPKRGNNVGNQIGLLWGDAK